MKTFPKLLFLFFCLIIIQVSFGQVQPVTGKVTVRGSNLGGVSVNVKNTTRGTTTNPDGTFTVQAKPGDVLQFTMVGHAPVEVTVTATSSIDVQMAEGQSNLDEIVLLGSRRAGRVKMETAVPVDVVNIGQVTLPTARMDLTSILNYVAPSFNFNKQTGSDGADHVDLATLRGLGPDQTLVLVNGKRRHQTAYVSVFGTRGRGASGTDLSAIPISSIDRVEILRDGAAAQYGSDAIAGVINIILKKNIKVFSGSVGAAGYYDNKFNTSFKDLGQYYTGSKLDGKSYSVNMNYGFGLGKQGGFFNLSTDLLRSEKTFRQALDTVFSHKNGLPINPVRRAYGDGSLMNVSTMYIMEIPFSGNATFYSFGGYTYKASEAYAYTRNFSARPDRFPTDANDELILVPSIMRTTSDGEIYYNPIIETKISDISFALGAKGTMKNGWNWDLSNISGRNNFHFYGDKTFNASLGATKTHFDDGGFLFFQNTTNINFDKEITGIAKGFHLAVGGEFRAENYQIFAGEKDSYENYSNGNKATGSQGFPGYQPEDEVNAKRSAVGAYLDAEIDVTDKWLVGAAVRVENYRDFGFTDNYKFSTRIKATENLNIRGSISSGFRAPSLQQINFSSTFTTVQGGTVAEVKIAPNYSAIAKAAGIPQLKQERSVNYSMGFTYRPVPAFSVTMDLYRVKIKDRVVLSGQFDASDASLDTILTSSLQSRNVGLAQFFANAVNTTNTGVDVVLEYNKQFNGNAFKALLTANFNDMEFDNINVPSKLNDTEQHRQTFLSDREKAFILAGAPKSKMAANFEYSVKKLTFGTRLTYFGKLTLLGYGADGLGIDPMVPTDADDQVFVKDEYKLGSKLVTDVYVSLRASKKFGIHIGADNLFNIHPDMSVVQNAKYWAYNDETGGPWDAVQMGSNGLRLFARLSFNF